MLRDKEEVNEIYPLIKEARLHNLWIYDPNAPRGEKWMTPDGFKEKYKDIKFNYSQSQVFMKGFKLRDPRESIGEFDKRIEKIKQEKEEFIKRVKKWYK